MRKILLFLLCATAVISTQAQELNCTVSIDAEQTGQPNLQIFKTLEIQLREFVNNTKWTDKEYKNQERIDCNMSLVVSQYDGDTFTATLQIQSSRPAFNSTYNTPVYNYFDKQVSFNYKEYEPLNFNMTTFGSNLVSVIAFHVYTIIGLDADTYVLNGGAPYFETAKQITNTAASSAFSGWKTTDGNQSRYRFNDALVSAVYKEFHDVMYEYHRDGIDIMASDQKMAKQKIADAINKLKGINDRRPNSYIVRTFFDAKSDEIQAIFSGGPQVDITKLLENLNRLAPTKRSNWSEIKF
ncbi:hypothetical protein Aeqsu_3229 [Aequorivita sublithincola DSM 14238]|uniref:DUF4835 domain-containing protein n=1 Tax=Aequorivita sublithincola (strain DSM 14238 / LMG 21431 / ACAM 643 / 9-3) TaxID=746697 RepID=I3Z090_AEQSU|nr:DUF4835 family protein [Aequorivita sublithincola]AFL82658.1 hypothetical protein Aeqsu_3229 [Aequorivita sublithincola DSM 14238]